MEGSKPAAGDDVVIAAAYNMTVDEATAAVKSWDMTGYTSTISGTFNITVTVASGTVTVLFAGTSPTWSGILLLNPAAGTTINLTMGSLTTAGTIGGITIAGTTTGMVNMLDNVTMGATKTVTLTTGTLHVDGAADSSGLTHSWGIAAMNGSGTRTLKLGTSGITITGTSAAPSNCPWLMNTTTGLTFDAGTSTITMTGSGANFNGGGKTFNNLIFSGVPGGVMAGTFVGANLTLTGRSVKIDDFAFAANATITNTLTINGNSITNRYLMRSNTLGTARTITAATVVTQYTDWKSHDSHQAAISSFVRPPRYGSSAAGTVTLPSAC